MDQGLGPFPTRLLVPRAAGIQMVVFPRSSAEAAALITTPGGSTIEPVAEGGYRVCDAGRHCLTASTLWEAQQLVQWAEVHHRRLA